MFNYKVKYDHTIESRDYDCYLLTRARERNVGGKRSGAGRQPAENRLERSGVVSRTTVNGAEQ